MGKRLVNALLVAVTFTLLTGGIAYAFLYKAPVSVTENASISYTMLPVLWSQNNVWLRDNGFFTTATANDTRVQTLGGANKPWMVADNKTLTAIPVPADSQTNLYFSTGESEASAMDIITGYGGYITRAYDPDWEPGANFTILLSGFFDTSATVTGNSSVRKLDAFRLYTPSTGNLTAQITGLGWVSPTGSVDAGAVWTNDANAFDDNLGTYAQAPNMGGAWTDFLELTRASTTVSSIRILTVKDVARPQADLDAYYGGAWNHVYEGVDWNNGAWTEKSLGGTYAVTALRFRQYTDGNIAVFYEADFYNTDLSVSAAVSGDHVVDITADSTNLSLSIDGVLADEVALAGYIVPNNANDWIIGSSNATPYLNYYQHYVGGVLVGWYQPNAIILGTVLPDRAGAAEDGVITWGANPAGVGATVGSMTSSGQSSIGGTSDTSTSDILPPVGGTDWRPSAEVSAALQANPLRPIVTAISDNTTLSEYQVWVWFGIIFVAFITVLVGSHVHGHHLITGIAASAAIILLVVWTIFPLLSLLVVVLAIWGGLISERSPSL